MTSICHYLWSLFKKIDKVLDSEVRATWELVEGYTQSGDFQSFDDDECMAQVE